PGRECPATAGGRDAAGRRRIATRRTGAMGRAMADTVLNISTTRRSRGGEWNGGGGCRRDEAPVGAGALPTRTTLPRPAPGRLARRTERKTPQDRRGIRGAAPRGCRLP